MPAAARLTSRRSRMPTKREAPPCPRGAVASRRTDASCRSPRGPAGGCEPACARARSGSARRQRLRLGDSHRRSSRTLPCRAPHRSTRSDLRTLQQLHRRSSSHLQATQRLRRSRRPQALPCPNTNSSTGFARSLDLLAQAVTHEGAINPLCRRIATAGMAIVCDHGRGRVGEVACMKRKRVASLRVATVSVLPLVHGCRAAYNAQA